MRSHMTLDLAPTAGRRKPNRKSAASPVDMVIEHASRAGAVAAISTLPDAANRAGDLLFRQLSTFQDDLVRNIPRHPPARKIARICLPNCRPIRVDGEIAIAAGAQAHPERGGALIHGR